MDPRQVADVSNDEGIASGNHAPLWSKGIAIAESTPGIVRPCERGGSGVTQAYNWKLQYVVASQVCDRRKRGACAAADQKNYCTSSSSDSTAVKDGTADTVD